MNNFTTLNYPLKIKTQSDDLISTMSMQSDLINKLDRRLNELENNFKDIQDFLDYKGITKEEFNDFKESRILAEKMIQSQNKSDNFSFNNITEFSYVFSPYIPTDKITFTYDLSLFKDNKDNKDDNNE